MSVSILYFKNSVIDLFSGNSRKEKKKGHPGIFLLKFVVFIIIFSLLYISSLYSYLLFHSLAEIFSIIIAFGIFIIFWNSRKFQENGYFLFIGIAFFFIASTDLLHTFAYKGMNIFPGYDANLPTQLWIASRYMESITFLTALLFTNRKIRAEIVFFCYSFIFVVLIGLIFYWKVFPDCFIEGRGLTPFKKISEYFISVFLILSIIFLYKIREKFDSSIFKLLIFSIILTVASELAFTFYIHAYGFSNLIGHFFKIISFYLIYKAVIETSLKHPYDILFRSLKQSEENLAEAQSIASIGNWEWNAYTDKLTWSDQMYRITGINRTKGLSSGLKEFNKICHPDDRESVLNDLERSFISAVPVNLDACIVNPCKNEITVNIIARPDFSSTGKVTGLSGTVQDISERKEFEDKLEANLEEKEILLKEIHHRVKNNFQVITSLLNIQEMSIKDDKSKEILRVSQNRIKSMSLVHEKFYKTKNLSSIDFSEYVNEFSNELSRLYLTAAKKINLNISIEKIYISIKQAIPCGLILNELLTNSFKHAFPPEFKGRCEIKIIMKKIDNMIELIVSDNGVGLSENINLKNIKSLGLRLLPSLVKQLNGEFKIDRTHGTCYIINFINNIS